MEYTLDRFLRAQEEAYPRALAEIQSGQKRSHWMWYIFPQLRGLGRSFESEYYGIRDRQEAMDYLAHPVLGARLLKISHALLSLEERDPRKILGYTDSAKLRSSMTLFHEAGHDPVFRKVLDEFFGGEPDILTLDKL